MRLPFFFFVPTVTMSRYKRCSVLFSHVTTCLGGSFESSRACLPQASHLSTVMLGMDRSLCGGHPGHSCPTRWMPVALPIVARKCLQTDARAALAENLWSAPLFRLVLGCFYLTR